MNNICSYDNFAFIESKDAKRRRIVEASYGTDLTLKEFAALQGVGYSTLVKWRKALKGTHSPSFLPVEVNEPTSRTTEARSSRVGITLVSGCKLDVRENIPSSDLKRLVSVVAGL